MLEEDEFSDGELDEENEMALFEMLKGNDKVGTTESTKDVWDSWLSFAGEEKPPEVGPPSPRPVVPTVTKTVPEAITVPVTKAVASDSVNSQEVIPIDEEMKPADPEDLEKDEDATEMRDTPTSQVAVAGQKAVAQVEGVQPSEEEEEVDLEGEMELFRHLKVPATPPVVASSTSTEASTVKGLNGLHSRSDYADMEIVSTASDEGTDFLLLSDEDEVEPPPPVVKVVATPPERKRKAATLEPKPTTDLVAVGDTVKIIKAAGGKEKLEGILATVSCHMPPSSFQLTLSDGQQVLRKRSQVCLVEKAAAASAVDTIAEKMPHKSSLLRQLKSAEVDRAEVLRGRKLEREAISTGRTSRGKGRGRGGRGRGMTQQLGVTKAPELGSSFNQLSSILDVETKGGARKKAAPPAPKARSNASAWGSRWTEGSRAR